jgi:lauroyl/myristoyl acyltransferase
VIGHRLKSLYARLSKDKFAATRLAFREAGFVNDERAVDDLLELNIAYTYGYHVRALRLGDERYRRRLQNTIVPEGLHNLLDARDPGSGVILTTVHVGDFDLAASWITQILGLPLVVPVARVHSSGRQGFYDRMRKACGFRLRFGEHLSLDALAGDLRAGSVVVLTMDRRPRMHGVSTPFFGKPAVMARAPWRLAAMTSMPIVSAATHLQADGSRTLRFGEPAQVSGYGQGAARLLTQRLAAEAERAIAARPEQWHVPATLEQLPWTRMDIERADHSRVGASQG